MTLVTDTRESAETPQAIAESASASPLRLLIGIDVFLAKAASDHPLAPYLALEERLRKALRAEFEDREEAAIEAARRRMGEEDSGARVTVAALLAASSAAGMIFAGMADTARVRETLREAIRAAYVEDRKRVLLRAARLRPGMVSVNPSFTIVDDAAVEALTRHQAYWIGNSYSRALSDRIAEVSRVMVTQGVSAREAATKLEQVLRAEFGLNTRLATGADALASTIGAPVQVPAGWQGTQIQYLDALSANTVTVGRTIGAVRGLRESGATTFEITATGAPNMCPFCGWMDGTRFSTSDGVDLADRLVQTKSPEDVRKIQPWMHLGAVLKATGLTRGDHGDRGGAKSSALLRYGKQLPPFHLLCHCTIDIVADSRFDGGE